VKFVPEQVATILSGDSFVDVSHGSAVVPTVDDIAITEHDNLVGRSKWIDNIDATKFRINISSIDAVNPHEFGWRLLSETYLPAAGRYGILVTVKNLCQIDLTDTSKDAQLDVTIKSADNIINNALKRAGAITPLTIPDDDIHDISNYISAGLFKQKDVPDEKLHSFYVLGLNMLNDYILTNYPGAIPLPGGSGSTPITNPSIAYGVG
jgi:hypothetical protein